MKYIIIIILIMSIVRSQDIIEMKEQIKEDLRNRNISKYRIEKENSLEDLILILNNQIEMKFNSLKLEYLKQLEIRIYKMFPDRVKKSFSNDN